MLSYDLTLNVLFVNNGGWKSETPLLQISLLDFQEDVGSVFSNMRKT